VLDTAEASTAVTAFTPGKLYFFRTEIMMGEINPLTYEDTNNNGVIDPGEQGSNGIGYDIRDDKSFYFPASYMRGDKIGWHPTTFRLGEVSDRDPPGGALQRNMSADGTFDEFYLWKIYLGQDIGSNDSDSGTEVSNGLKKLWQFGRYYNPFYGGATFKSSPINLTILGRVPPPSDTLSPPTGGGDGHCVHAVGDRGANPVVGRIMDLVRRRVY
jgi:hypothetical protein